MKRTEKIEVRVSLEEKQTLSELAKQDGDSVSGLIRGLVEKYIALNAANTTRKLPKWQIAAGLIVAAFIGHALTLLPMHLHERGHQSADITPTYWVHGAIGRAAFGVGVSEKQPTQSVNIQNENGENMIVRLVFKPTGNGSGTLNLKVCEIETNDECVTAFGGDMDISRRAPSVLGNSTKSGKPIHVFVQEMA